jgi:hypothetical protein
MSSLFNAPQALPTFLSFENLALRIQTPSQVHSVLPADKMSATTAGLTNGGKTTYYILSYIFLPLAALILRILSSLSWMPTSPKCPCGSTSRVKAC